MNCLEEQPTPERETYKKVDNRSVLNPQRKQVKFSSNFTTPPKRSKIPSALTQSVPDFSSALRKENLRPVALPPVVERSATTPAAMLKSGRKSTNSAEKRSGGGLMARKSYANLDELKKLGVSTGKEINELHTIRRDDRNPSAELLIARPEILHPRSHRGHNRSERRSGNPLRSHESHQTNPLAEAALEPTGNLRLGFGASSEMKVIGGTMNENWCICVKATHIGSETALSQIVELVEAGQLAKAPVQKLADQISMFFIPTVSISFFPSYAPLELGSCSVTPLLTERSNSISKNRVDRL
ncbi:probable copper-transporting ATPase hma5 [Phtheirospermum japonicum]|uniref:Probable copper-transporting ATPase hma5 n=1 Tax=Phtheirospermum japonicum TaxID=374723 RepID=A0A830CNV0_9LAMI|nr:probable copper-transporting ATPase hma5 [Phtheirospermum japonicum]